jgi:hypothetical protein
MSVAVTRRWVMVVSAGLLLVLAGCNAFGKSSPSDSVEVSGSASWSMLPESPLSPRYSPLAVWDGSEFLLVGGYNGSPCPPNADCAGADHELSDGAAFDPQSSRWRVLANSPVPVSGEADGQSVVVGDRLFLLDTDDDRRQATTTFLSYDITDDRWTRLPVPDLRNAWLIAAGDSVVAVGESGPKNLVFDPVAVRWRPLPKSPLPHGGETGVWTGHKLLVAEHADVPNDQPPVVRLASLNQGLNRWTLLPDSKIVGQGPVAVAGRVIWPSPETLDGGEVDNWGHSYDEGGIYDPSTGAWSKLPARPDNGGLDCCANTDQLVNIYGNLLDPITLEWITVPKPPGGSRNSPGVAGGKDVALVWGGAPYGHEDEGSLATGFILHTPQ